MWLVEPSTREQMHVHSEAVRFTGIFPGAISVRQRLLAGLAPSQWERVLVVLAVIAIIVAGTWVLDWQIEAGLGNRCESGAAC